MRLDQDLNRRKIIMAILGLFGILAVFGLNAAHAKPKKKPEQKKEQKKRKWRASTEKEINEAGYVKVQMPHKQDGTGGAYVWLPKNLDGAMTIDHDVVLQFQNRTDKEIDQHFSDWPNTILRAFVKRNG